jgi:nitrogen fixation NifU-like protein
MGGFSGPLREHFDAPRNAGRLEGHDGAGRAENAACGDVVEIFVKRKGDAVERATFLCRGCSASIGAASFVAALAAGKPVADLRRLTADDVVAQVGGVDPPRRHAVELAVRALAAALRTPG